MARKRPQFKVPAMEVRTVEAVVHGRILYEHRPGDRLLVGFHGYAENADRHMAELQSIPGAREWSIAAIQALHPFYGRKGEEVVASWMTKLDRELAITDNLSYVRRALAAIGTRKTVVFAGFSQGVAMAYRAAASIAPVAGVIALAGDIPPDVDPATLPPALMGRGSRDEWYSEEKLGRDLAALPSATVCRFDGAHEWTDEFRLAAGAFLSRF